MTGIGKWLLLGVILAALGAVVACGGGGDPSGEQITERVADAVRDDGMVYHAVVDNGSEIWLDTKNEKYRRTDVSEAGPLISVGDGWTEISYDPLSNKVTEQDQNPTGPTRPRIDDPMITWFEPLGALAFAQEFDVIGKTSAGGRIVLAVEAKTPITSNGQPTGHTLVGRVEVDPETYLPLAYERREDVPPEETPSSQRVRVVYTTSELIPRSDLPDDWFDRAAVDDQKLTVAENLQMARDLGITPYWLDENYESATGILSLPPDDAAFTDPENVQSELHYALIVPTSGSEVAPQLDAVVVRMGLNPNGFGPPTIEQITGNLPEGSNPIDGARDDPMAVMYTSLLSPADLGCGNVECPKTTAKLYRRVIFSIGDTVIQIEAFAKIDPDGNDLNKFNSVNGLLELADALTEAMAE